MENPDHPNIFSLNKNNQNVLSDCCMKKNDDQQEKVRKTA